MLHEDLLNDWISPQVEGSRELVSAITDAGRSVATQLTATAVSSAVGNVRNNSPELIQAIDIDR